jgi:geranylgeranyl diphosphate synthase type I
MALKEALARLLPLVEDGLRAAIAPAAPEFAPHYGMMAYHLGFADSQLRPVHANAGKRIRPLLCLLTCEAAGGRAEDALPAAVALELLHNFSLIHDDIEDGSPTRRHRETVWKVWGVPQAVNVGDAMFTLARLALLGLREKGLAAEAVLAAVLAFDRTCQALTEGQYLDMAFEGRATVSMDEYLRMIAGKTGALLGLSAELGALSAGAPAATVASYRQFGLALGRAFQIEDDILGVWGDEAQTGKSAQSDILSCKKSLPMAHAMAQETAGGEALRRLCERALVTPADVPAVLQWLEEAGSRPYATAMMRDAHTQAVKALRAATPRGTAALALQELCDQLVARSS